MHNVSMLMDTQPRSLIRHFKKDGNVCDFLYAFLEDKVFPEEGQLLQERTSS